MNPDMLSFSLKKSQQANPLHVPQWAPYGKRYPLTGYFYVSLNVYLFIFPSESPVREPPPCFLTSLGQGYSITRAIGLFIHSFIRSFTYVCRSPQKGALLQLGKNVRSPSTEPHADPSAMQPLAQYLPPWLG